jgi:hypothetical protein
MIPASSARDCVVRTSSPDNVIRMREQRSADARRANERLFDPIGVRARLLARQAGQDCA